MPSFDTLSFMTPFINPFFGLKFILRKQVWMTQPGHEQWTVAASPSFWSREKARSSSEELKQDWNPDKLISDEAITKRNFSTVQLANHFLWRCFFSWAGSPYVISFLATEKEYAGLFPWWGRNTIMWKISEWSPITTHFSWLNKSTHSPPPARTGMTFPTDKIRGLSTNVILLEIGPYLVE